MIYLVFAAIPVALALVAFAITAIVTAVRGNRRTP